MCLLPRRDLGCFESKIIFLFHLLNRKRSGYECHMHISMYTCMYSIYPSYQYILYFNTTRASGNFRKCHATWKTTKESFTVERVSFSLAHAQFGSKTAVESNDLGNYHHRNRKERTRSCHWMDLSFMVNDNLHLFPVFPVILVLMKGSFDGFPLLRWPTSASAKHAFPRQNILFHYSCPTVKIAFYEFLRYVVFFTHRIWITCSPHLNSNLNSTTYTSKWFQRTYDGPVFRSLYH